MKGKPFLKKIFPHIIAIIIFLIASAIYFQPIFQGKQLPQGDVIKSEGMSKELKDYHKKTGDYSLWCSAMFSGMPAYHVYTPPDQNIFKTIGRTLMLGDFGMNLGCLFLYLLGFYVCLVAFGVNPWLSLIGALAFGLGSYNIIIIEAGHMLKCWAISMFAPILGGMALVFKRKYWTGGLLFFVALGLQLYFNHIQITYYTVITAICMGIAYFIYDYKSKQLKLFFIAISILIGLAVIATLPNSTALLVNQQSVKYTMRGGSEITVTPQNLKNNNSTTDAKSEKGLDIDYAFRWSYGIGETFTILIPGINGGGSREPVSKDSEFYKNFRSEYAPLYWGDQPFTSGPVYFGAIICFLFVLGLFIVKGHEKWWIVAATIISIVLSWGKSCMWINEFLFNYMPLYNKFRVPSMALVIANVTMVLMAILALKSIFTEKWGKKKLTKNLYISTAITGGLCLLFIIISGSFSYTGINDSGYQPQVLDIIIEARKSLLISDSFRSLIFILLSAGVIWAYVQGKLKNQYMIIALLGLLIVIDLWGIDKRYLNDGQFVKKQKEMISPTQHDIQIKQAAAQYGDVDYRVFNLAGDPFNDSYISYFHHSIGGYNAAKLRRYQDVIDFYLSKVHFGVMNMLNTRYIIVPNGQNEPIVQRNPDALGSAWFVNDYKLVNNPDEEILALDELNPVQTAIIDKTFASYLKNYHNKIDSSAAIDLIIGEIYKPHHLTYKTKTSKDQLAIFSEIYYKDGWSAYIDGKLVPHFRANYILRGMIIPAGEHVVEFKFEPSIYRTATNIAIFGSIIAIFVILILAYLGIKQKKFRDDGK